MPATDPHPRHILIVRPSALGDVARSVPVAASLRAQFPDAKIDWLVRDDFADAVRAHPAVDQAIEFPRRAFRRWWYHPGVARQLWHYVRDLAGRDYDTVYDLQGLLRSGLLTRFTSAPRRVGFANAREGAPLCYNQAHRIDRSLHTVERMLGLIAADGVNIVRDMRLYVPDVHRAWADALLTEHGLSAERYAVIAPTARWRSKRWPIDRVANIADRLPELGLDEAFVVGSPGEQPQASPLFQQDCNAGTRLIDMVGRTTVGQMMALLAQSALVICNDSAALHMAVGLGRRAVAVYGPTDPSVVGPYGYGMSVAGPPHAERVDYNFKRVDESIIAAVSADEVWRITQRVMEAPPPAQVHDAAPVTAES